MDTQPTQSDKFKKAARELDCDQDEARWDETVRTIAAHKPTDTEPGKTE